jgi:hypothetical protein
MKKAAKWVMFLKRCMSGATKASIFRLSKRRLIAGCVALLGGLLLAGSLAQAFPIDIDGDDILVADGGANKLILVDGKTGVRSVLSDFSNPTQGPISNSAINTVGVGRGQIFATVPTEGIFRVDPRTGHRSLVSNFNQGAIQGLVGRGVAVDAYGRVLATVDRAIHFDEFRELVRVAPKTDTRVIVTDLTNPAQGGDLSAYLITDLTLEHPGGAIIIGTEFLEFKHAGQAAIYRVDPVTGDRSLLSDFSNPAQGTDVVDLENSVGLAVEHSGMILANSGGNGVRNLLLRIDPQSGNRTVLSDFDNAAQGPLGTDLVGAAVQYSGHVFVAAGDPTASDPTQRNKLFRVNPHTGRRVVFSDSTNPSQGPSFINISYVAVVPRHAGFCASPPTGSFVSPFGPTK